MLKARLPTAVVRACPLCRSTDRELLFDNRVALLDELDMSYAVCECNACRFVYAGELPPPSAYESYYGRYSKYDQAIAVSAMDTVRGKAALSLIESVVPRDAVVVDVGCGSGALLSLLQEAGYQNLHGLDPAPQASQRAKDLFGLTGVRRGTMADCHEHVPMERADLVMVMAVLEHLWDPQRDIAGLIARLRPGTRVMIEVPALDSFDGNRAEPYGELSLEHIQYFSRECLDALMAAAGATPVRCREVELEGMSGRALLALYEVRPAGSSAAQSPASPGGAVMRRYLELCSVRMEHALLRIPAKDILVYGAGAHTARLLPRLGRTAGTAVRLLIDANSNLQGSRMGGIRIAGPDEISRLPDLPVLISSYRFQDEIAHQLASRFPNELIKLY